MYMNGKTDKSLSSAIFLNLIMKKIASLAESWAALHSVEGVKECKYIIVLSFKSFI